MGSLRAEAGSNRPAIIGASTHFLNLALNLEYAEADFYTVSKMIFRQPVVGTCIPTGEQNGLAVTGVYFSSGLYNCFFRAIWRVRKELGMNLTRRDMIRLTTALPAAAWLNDYHAFA